MGSLGNRIKRYEQVFNQTAVPRMPLIIRVDGRAFHTFTRKMDKPFDQGFMNAMVYAARKVACQMQGFKAAYVQSDEVTFCLTDYDRLNSQGWFDYEINKVVSLSAATMSVYFGRVFKDVGTPPTFDSRAFSVPREDVSNVFLWRAQDWARNSLQMYAHANFSHKQLHQKNQIDMHEMLHSIGKNWTTDLNSMERNGTFLIAGEEGVLANSSILPSYKSIDGVIEQLLAAKEAVV